ncbi:hypothetical protein G6F22_014635 [Rhizopus arrhizus]|nr:hypothetical protein G6F22_014635 [Rhizopus arrhizus]
MITSHWPARRRNSRATAPFGARAADHLGEIAVLLGTVAVAHAVVAGQVAGRFRGGDDVVSGNGQFGARQRHRHAHGAQRFELGQGGFHRGGHVGGQAGAEILLRHADAQALQGLAAGGVKCGLGRIEVAADAARFVDGGVALFQAGGVARIEAADDIQQFKQVAAAGGQRARRPRDRAAGRRFFWTTGGQQLVLARSCDARPAGGGRQAARGPGCGAPVGVSAGCGAHDGGAVGAAVGASAVREFPYGGPLGRRRLAFGHVGPTRGSAARRARVVARLPMVAGPSGLALRADAARVAGDALFMAHPGADGQRAPASRAG